MFEFLKRSNNKDLLFNSVQFDAEIKKAEFIKIVPLGSFPLHPYGAHIIEAKHVAEMARNFNNTKVDLLFDYEHRSLWGDTRAAGWSGEVQAREDGLYARQPEWTPKASEAIQNREYRYLSPVYRLTSKDKLGREIGALVVSVALTNTPYMDNEIDHIKNSKGEEDMELKELLKALGLPENVTPEELQMKINSAREKAGLPATASLDQILAAVTKPAEPQKPEPEIKTNSATEDRIAKLEKELADGKVSGLIDGAITEGKILPAVREIWINSAKADFAGTKTKLDALARNSAVPDVVKKPAESVDQKVNSIANAIAHMKGFNRQPQPSARA